MFLPDLLAGQRLLITGGGSGLGAAMAERLGQLGASLLLCGRRAEVLQATADRLRALGTTVDTAVCDVRDANAVEALVETAWQQAPIDGLINNAAATFIAQTETLSARAVDAILATTLHGAMYATLAVGKRWIASGRPGTVLSILSTSTITGRAYTVPSAMAKSGLLAMTRSLDASTSDELEQAITTVEEGTSAGTSWRQSVVNFVLDTGNATWLQFGSSIGAASETSSGIAEIATQAETDGGTDDLRFVTPLKLNTWANKTRRAQATIGDGSSTQFDVNHNFATRDVVVQVYQASGSYEQVTCDVSLPTTNTARLNFAAAPASNAYRVVVMG